MADWYRHKSWTKEDEESFFTKLARAQKASRAQYLKVQAIELVATKELPLLDVAESLINKLFAEYPEDRFNRPGGLTTLGEIYNLRNDFSRAMEYYKQALDFEIVYPQVRTQAYLEYSELVIKTNSVDRFDEVEQLLMDRTHRTLFPIEKYIGYSILSIINTYNGLTFEAQEYAKLADKFANQETSGLRYHKKLGVVKQRENWLDMLVYRIKNKG